MMNFFAVVFLFLAVTLSADSISEGSIELMPVENSSQFAVAVMVHGKTSADRALITYQYWQTSPLGKLLVSRTAVIDVVPEVYVMADGVPASGDEIASIDLVLVKDVENHHFKFHDKGKP
jgi:hypothetical protein